MPYKNEPSEPDPDDFGTDPDLVEAQAHLEESEQTGEAGDWNPSVPGYYPPPNVPRHYIRMRPGDPNTPEATAENYNMFIHKRGVPSHVFRPGERLSLGSLLTVIGPGYKNRYGQPTYKTVLCRCECGNELTISYLSAYQGKYSCGCRRRIAARLDRPEKVVDAIMACPDSRGLTIEHPRTGRGVVVLYLDERSSDMNIHAWVCMRKCCGDEGVATVAGHFDVAEYKLLKKLYEELGRQCPNIDCPTRNSEAVKRAREAYVRATIPPSPFSDPASNR